MATPRASETDSRLSTSGAPLLGQTDSCLPGKAAGVRTQTDSCLSRARPAPARAARALLAWCALAAGCGYTLVRGAALPGGGRALRAGAFVNQTAMAEAGGLFAGALREALAAHGRLAADGDLSAAQLQGELRVVHDSTSALGATGASAFHLDAEVMLRVLGPQGVAYEDDARAGEDYLQGVDVLGTEANRRAALRRLADKLAREALERMELSQ